MNSMKIEKIFIPSITIIAGIVVALISYAAGVYNTQRGAFLQNTIESKKELAESLANYYSASAEIYYAEIDLNNADARKFDKNSLYYIAVLNEENKDYVAFINATTNLASHVPINLRDKVLDIEHLWDKIDVDNLDASITEKEWFDNLDDVRQTVLDQLTNQKSLDPIWK